MAWISPLTCSFPANVPMMPASVLPKPSTALDSYPVSAMTAPLSSPGQRMRKVRSRKEPMEWPSMK